MSDVKGMSIYPAMTIEMSYLTKSDIIRGVHMCFSEHGYTESCNAQTPRLNRTSTFSTGPQ